MVFLLERGGGGGSDPVREQGGGGGGGGGRGLTSRNIEKKVRLRRDFEELGRSILFRHVQKSKFKEIALG